MSIGVKGEQHLTKPDDFVRVHSQGQWLGGKLAGIKSRPNGLGLVRYGFVVGKRIGSAVVRNRVKRRLREILRSTRLKLGNDIIIIARSEAAQASFAELKALIMKLLAQANLLEESNEENCPRAD